MRRTVYGHSKNNTVITPYSGVISAQVMMSTYSGDAVIDWGDGSVIENKLSEKLKDYTVTAVSAVSNHSYSELFTGEVKVLFTNGVNDIYSWRSTNGARASEGANKYTIEDIETYFAQMPSLYSISFSDYSYSMPARQSVVKGDFSRIPNSVERMGLTALDVFDSVNNLVLNLSNFNTNTSNLKWLRVADGTGASSRIKAVGDLSKLPKLCNHFFISTALAGSAITYTAGKIWPTSFDSLRVPITLTSTELDQLLIDLNNSITTAIGDKIIYLKGTRTTASDAAVSGLTTKGFTVTIIA